MEVSDIIDRLFLAADSSSFDPAEFKMLLAEAKLQLVDFVRVRWRQNRTLLHFIAGYGRAKLTSYLISEGSDVNARDDEGSAPLHTACCHGHFNTSSRLIEAGAHVDLTDNRGWSPLHFAVARANKSAKISPVYWKVIELLLSSGANPYIKSNSGRDCLSRIKDKDDKRTVKLLHLLAQLKMCHDDEDRRIALVDEYMSIEDFFECVLGGDENLDVITALTTPRLINSKLESIDYITPLHRAAGFNHLGLATLFLSKGAKVDATDKYGRIPLHNAAEYNHIEMIELLINAGSEINKQDLVSGYTPLHIAAFNHTFTACLKLLELGASVHLKCNKGQLPYDLAKSDDVKEVLNPDTRRHRIDTETSSSDQAIYYSLEAGQLQEEPNQHRSLPDELMLDSSSDEQLFASTTSSLKKIRLEQEGWRFQEIRRRMFDTIMVHNSESGGRYRGYEIISIEQILHKKVWSKYKLMCQRLEIDYGKGSKNEKLLFHGSNFIDRIQTNGFDERYAQRDNMFGAGIYFAEHSSKSNQYTFGWGLGCLEHKNKSCYECERQMILAQVALGRSLISKEPLKCAHAPPGYSSVVGSPGSTDNLIYPEYTVYNGDQAYPLYIIRYRITI